MEIERIVASGGGLCYAKTVTNTLLQVAMTLLIVQRHLRSLSSRLPGGLSRVGQKDQCITWNLAMYNNTRNQDNFKTIATQLLRKFSKISANNKISFQVICTHRVFEWRIAAIRSRRNRFRIRYRLSSNWKIIRAVVNACPSIFQHSQCIRTERHLFMWEDRNPPRWACKIRKRTICNLSLSTPIYRDLH